MNALTYQSGEAMSLERFALGALVLCILNFGAGVMTAVITPFAMIFVGMILQHLNIVQIDPPPYQIVFNVFVFAVLGCFISAGIVAYIFYWGVKSLFSGKVVSSLVFLFLIIALHIFLAWFAGWRTTNWFNVGIGCLSIINISIHWSRTFFRTLGERV
jgi:hypothetical protein